MKGIKSKVMTIANALVKQGVSRRAAMFRTWITVKLRAIQTKAAGVTHGNRQTLLERLTRYSPEDISVTLRREKDNVHDKNAVQIVAAVRGKGSAVIGYINRELAAALAPLLDKGVQIASRFKKVTGGGMVTTDDFNELYRMSASELDLITKAFRFGYLQGTKAEKRAKKRKAV